MYQSKMCPPHCFGSSSGTKPSNSSVPTLKHCSREKRNGCDAEAKKKARAVQTTIDSDVTEDSAKVASGPLPEAMSLLCRYHKWCLQTSCPKTFDLELVQC